MSEKKCPSDKILNPVSGKCVKRSGKIGKTLLSPKPSSETTRTTAKPSGTKTCLPDKILNPATGKCVKRSGKIGIINYIKKFLDDISPDEFKENFSGIVNVILVSTKIRPGAALEKQFNTEISITKQKFINKLENLLDNLNINYNNIGDISLGKIPKKNASIKNYGKFLGYECYNQKWQPDSIKRTAFGIYSKTPYKKQIFSEFCVENFEELHRIYKEKNIKINKILNLYGIETVYTKKSKYG